MLGSLEACANGSKVNGGEESRPHMSVPPGTAMAKKTNGSYKKFMVDDAILLFLKK